MTYGTFLTSLIINSSFKFKRCLKNNKDLMKLKEIKNPFSIIVVFFFFNKCCFAKANCEQFVIATTTLI